MVRSRRDGVAFAQSPIDLLPQVEFDLQDEIMYKLNGNNAYGTRTLF